MCFMVFWYSKIKANQDKILKVLIYFREGLKTQMNI